MPNTTVKIKSVTAATKFPQYESDFSDPTDLRVPWDVAPNASVEYVVSRAQKRINDKGLRAGWAAAESMNVLAPEIMEELAAAGLDPSIRHDLLPEFWVRGSNCLSRVER